jgi:hypothetical protein
VLCIEEDAEIEIAPAESLNLFGRNEVTHVNFERRFDFVESREEADEPLDREVQCAPDAELRADTAGFARFGECVVESREDAASLVCENTAGLGLRNEAARASEQRYTELVLEFPDRLGQRWLRYVEPLSSPSEVELLADREEIPQMAKLDRGMRRSFV